jgi:hypothetical protein
MQLRSYMNTDKLTTYLGAIAAVSTALSQGGVLPATYANYFGLASALSLGLLGFFTNKGVTVTRELR